MRLKNILLVVEDVERSRRFYEELFGLHVITAFDGNMILTEGLVLQDREIWEKLTGKKVKNAGNNAELYFEENELTKFAGKLEESDWNITYVNPLKEESGGQQVIRIYDPDGHLIEIGESLEHAEKRQKEGFAKMERNLVDIMKEEQAKLGFRKEAVRLYYPLATLQHFFHAEDTAEEMQERLQAFPEEFTDKLENVQVTHKKDRFCIHIPEEGSVYAKEQMKDNEFIKELIRQVQQCDCTIEDLKKLFEAHSDQVIFETMSNGEFDYLLRFADGVPDDYYYCFKDEGCHMVYHRFLPEDYKDFDF